MTYAPIYEGAAGISSYEPVSGFGEYNVMSSSLRGLGALGLTEPGGYKSGNKVCQLGVTTKDPGCASKLQFPKVAALCNKTSSPMCCYMAATTGKNYLGRDCQAQGWVAWLAAQGAQTGPNDMGMQKVTADIGSVGPVSATSIGGGDDNTMLYVGIGAAVLVLGTAVVYRMRKK